MTMMINGDESEGVLPAGCARLERDLAGFLDGTLDRRRSELVAEHLSTCARCAALLEGLESPSEAGLAMAAAPAMRAPGHLWSGVSERIAAPVAAIGLRQSPSAERRALLNRGWRVGLAAAGLVVMTAGVTYSLTVRGRLGSMPVATQVATTAPIATPQLASTSPETHTATVPDEPTVIPPPQLTTVARSSVGARRSTLTLASLPADPERETYDREIAKLRLVLTQRRGDLDTSTVRVLTQSMKVIDRAIAQSKAALARDPASGFLNKQLNSALDQKLELLRTAALLPART